MDDFELRSRDGEDLLEAIKHPALYKHRYLLSKLVHDRICCVFYSDKVGFSIQECCDDWFTHKLTRDECLELSEMFKDISFYID